MGVDGSFFLRTIKCPNYQTFLAKVDEFGQWKPSKKGWQYRGLSQGNPRGTLGQRMLLTQNVGPSLRRMR